MRILSGFLYLFASLLRRPLLWWVSRQVAPGGLPGSLQLDPSRPVCYVLPGKSIVDQFVLEETCLQQGLPLPRSGRELPKPGRAALVPLPKMEGRGMQRHYGDPDTMLRMVAQAMSDRAYNVQMVPVSIFWGRNPEQETSLLRIVFSDSLRAGALRKLLIVLVNGRNTFVTFGRPVSFQEFMGETIEPNAATRKLVRVLRVHFRRQRIATLGPSLINRAQVISAALAAPSVRDAVRAESAEAGTTLAQAEEKAWSYANEIAADYNNAAISFMVRILTWLWNRIFNGIQVFHAERLRTVAHGNSIIYLPAHRSHLDYLLVGFALYQLGLVPPHVAAGENLNFWPVGGLLRRCGAFYLKRKFGGNKLYTAVFRAYVDVLLARGYSLQFFPEGGRSRTGRLLTPKTGLLSMVVQSYLRNADKRVMLVPVYVGYDRVAEVNSYFKELRGTAKKNESIAGLIRASNVVTTRYGKPYISFGEAISLADYLDAHEPAWRRDTNNPDPDFRPAWLNRVVTSLAGEVMTGINSAAVMNPVGLVTAALLASPQKALAEDELVEQLDAYAAILRTQPYGPDVRTMDMDGQAMLAYTEGISKLTRAQHPWGDVIALEGKLGVLLTYNRNCVLHLLALPSLIASFFQERETLEVTALVRGCLDLYPFMRRELFLRWPEGEAEDAVRRTIDAFVGRRLLIRDIDRGLLRRPPVTTPEFGALHGLGLILRETLERYCMTTVLLAENLAIGYIDRAEFEHQCHLMAQRMAILSGRNAPEFFDKALFSSYIDTVKALGLLRPDPDAGDQRLAIDPRVQTMAIQAMQHLSVEVQQRIRRLTTRPRRAPLLTAVKTGTDSR